jgi:hypothetical protein
MLSDLSARCFFGNLKSEMLKYEVALYNNPFLFLYFWQAKKGYGRRKRNIGKPKRRTNRFNA